VKGAEVAGNGADQCDAAESTVAEERTGARLPWTASSPRDAAMAGGEAPRGLLPRRGEIGGGRAPPPASMGGGGGAPLGPPPWSRWRSSAGGWQARRRAPVEAEGGGLDDDARRWTRPEAAGDGVGEGRVVRLPTGVGLGLNG
jgi:hypothetical protein